MHVHVWCPHVYVRPSLGAHVCLFVVVLFEGGYLSVIHCSVLEFGPVPHFTRPETRHTRTLLGPMLGPRPSDLSALCLWTLLSLWSLLSALSRSCIYTTLTPTRNIFNFITKYEA